MNLLETSFLVDYENGNEVAHQYYDSNPRETFAASTISMFELGFGVVWDGTRSLDALHESLQWVDFLDFSVTDALEAAMIQAELQRNGTRIPIGDMLIAGVARNRGATLVAGDSHFENVENLSFENHRGGN